MMIKRFGLFVALSMSVSALAADRMELIADLLEAKMPLAAIKTYEQVLAEEGNGPRYLKALNGLVTLATTPGTELLVSQVLWRAYLKHPDVLKALDSDNKQSANFILAKRFIRAGKKEEARALALTVEPKHPAYPRAQYLLALATLDNYETARGYFENVRKTIAADSKDPELFNLRNNATLGIARLHYENAYRLPESDPSRKTLIKLSIEEYRNVPRFSKAWEHAMFELAWANSVLENYGEALGAVKSLQHPYFKDAYFPEAEIVSATVYWFNCQWDRANRALKSWNDKYEPILSQLKAVSEKDAIKSWDSLSQFPTLIAEEIAKDPQYKVFVSLIADLNAENARSLGPSFSDFYAKSIADLKKTALSWVRSHTKELLSDLEDVKTRNGFLSLETKTAEAKWLEEGREISGIKRKVLPRPFVRKDAQQFWWSSKENWQDELGWTVVAVKSECYL